MTVGFQNVGYANYPQTNVLKQAETKVANTSIQDSYKPTEAKTNKGAVAVGLTAAAGIALTAFAASKGKQITGQDKLLGNLKAGFSQIKDDVVKYAKAAWKKIKNSGAVTSTETIKPNTVETGLSVITNSATQTADDVIQNTSKTVKGIVDTYFDEAGKKISITNDGYKIVEDLKGFNLSNPEKTINEYYSYQSKSEKAKELLKSTYDKAIEFLSGIKNSITNYINK